MLFGLMKEIQGDVDQSPKERLARFEEKKQPDCRDHSENWCYFRPVLIFCQLLDHCFSPVLKSRKVTLLLYCNNPNRRVGVVDIFIIKPGGGAISRRILLIETEKKLLN